MKTNKILSLSALTVLSLAFTGCAGEEDDLFANSAAERLNIATAEYTQRFADKGGKWTMEYYPTTRSDIEFDDKTKKFIGGKPQCLGYLMLLDFNTDKSVKVAMNNNFTRNVYKEDVSVWEMIADNGPVLSFSTYNQCLHAFSDPDDLSFTTGTLNDETGLGAEGDYEFMVLDLEENASEALLKGKKRGVYDRLVRLPEDTDFSEYMADVMAFKNRVFPEQAPNNSMMVLGEDSFQIECAASGMMNIYPYHGNSVSDEDFYPYLITKHDGKYYLRFRDVITKGDDTRKTQEFVYDDEADKFYGTTDDAVIEGGLPAPFFCTSLEDGKTLRLTRTSEASESISELISVLYQQFKAVGNTLSNINLTQNVNGDIVCTMPFTFKLNRVTVSGSAVYLFSLKETSDGIAFEYKEPGNETGTLLLETVPVLNDFIAQLAKSYIVEAQASRFDMRALKLISVDNASDWFVVSLLN